MNVFIYDTCDVYYFLIHIKSISSPSCSELDSVKNDKKRKTADTLETYGMDSSNHLDEGSISSSIKKGKKAKAKEVTNVQLPSYNLFQSQNGINIVLKECVRRDLFPKLKFFDTMDDAIYRNNRNSVCYAILNSLQMNKIDSNMKTEFWYLHHARIKVYLAHHRNNVIKRIKKIASGKYFNSMV